MTALATAADWARWLRPVAASVRNPPTDADFRGRCGALAFALRVPAAALTDAKARDLCRSAQFWPSVEEVENLFAEAWKEHARSRAIATAGGANLLTAEQRIAPTPEETEAVRVKAAAFYAEMAARETAARPAAKAAPLPPHDLLAAYERSDSPAMQFRAAQLRQALEA